MKIALCTTTINVPTVLKLYRACDPRVRFFVAVDEKTPGAANVFIDAIEDARHYFQGDSHWKCSKLIGFNTLARRNIAFLEALKWGAELIVTVDDDNIPMSLDYFDRFEILFYSAFSGLCVKGNWFDPGMLLQPDVRQRGVPKHIQKSVRLEHIVDARIGVATGMVMGDTDQDATTRLAAFQPVLSPNAIGVAGVVADLDTLTVFNSQVTCFRRELAPAMFMMPNVGRMDDIYASLITRRVMRERELYCHYGLPLVWQQRNDHDLIKDLRQEIDGYENVPKLAAFLDAIPLLGKSVIDDTRIIYGALREFDPVSHAVDAAMAFLEDCESIL